MTIPQNLFIAWLTAACGLTNPQIKPLTPDASFRRYYRVRDGKNSYVAMDASLEKKSCVPYIAIANALRAKNLYAPEIFAQDLTQGFLLISDFGDKLYLNELNQNNAEILYKNALDVLLMLQTCAAPNIPPFTAEFMRLELDWFREWFLEKYLQLTLLDETNAELNTAFDFLAKACAEQPQVFMHRDYHSANLMVLPNNHVGILDFQDAFIGPITYDLVSLLRDCYIAWPQEFVKKNIIYFWKNLALPNVGIEEFSRWFDLMSVQRHLKALLTFSRKYCRDGSSTYLQHIPRTLNYILQESAHYPECAFLHAFLKSLEEKICVA